MRRLTDTGDAVLLHKGAIIDRFRVKQHFLWTVAERVDAPTAVGVTLWVSD